MLVYNWRERKGRETEGGGGGTEADLQVGMGVCVFTKEAASQQPALLRLYTSAVK